MKKSFIAVILASCMFTTTVYAKELPKEQEKIANKVAEEVSKKWKRYGVLPSVAVSQTFIESSLGKHQVRPNNLWGLRPNGKYSSYGSLENGINAYLKVLNNGRYDEALHKKDYHTQLKEILAGGYYGEDDGGTNEQYYKNCVRSIKKYNFDKYDQELFKKLQEKAERKRKSKWNKTYTLHYDKTLASHEISVDKRIIKGGAVQIWENCERRGIYDVTGGQKGRNIGISVPEMDGMKVKIKVCENAKG